MKDSRALRALLLEGLDDMLNLWWVEGRIALLHGRRSGDPSLVEPTVMAIRDLLAAGYAIAGRVTKDQSDGLLMVEPWDLPVDDAIRRIEKEWGELGELSMGDVVWLELTESGREEARRLDEAGCDPFSKGSTDE